MLVNQPTAWTANTTCIKLQQQIFPKIQKTKKMAPIIIYISVKLKSRKVKLVEWVKVYINSTVSYLGVKQ